MWHRKYGLIGEARELGQSCIFRYLTEWTSAKSNLGTSYRYPWVIPPTTDLLTLHFSFLALWPDLILYLFYYRGILNSHSAKINVFFFNYCLSHCLYSKGKAHTKDSNIFDTRINPVMILSCILLTRYGQNLSFSAKTNPLINIQQSFCTFMQLITHLQP
jgi:hypothetical protein